MDKKSYYRLMVRHYAGKYGFKPQAVFESSDANQLISLVNKGRGVAFLHKDYNKLSAAAKRFIDFIRNNC